MDDTEKWLWSEVSTAWCISLPAKQCVCVCVRARRGPNRKIARFPVFHSLRGRHKMTTSTIYLPQIVINTAHSRALAINEWSHLVPSSTCAYIALRIDDSVELRTPFQSPQMICSSTSFPQKCACHIHNNYLHFLSLGAHWILTLLQTRADSAGTCRLHIVHTWMSVSIPMAQDHAPTT
jgi:hypothetical protein